MSSTRTAADDSKFRQERYASSTEFERGLLANLVAKRCALIDDAADRELIWFVQFLSHRDGGLAAVAAELLAKYPERIGTQTMLRLAKPASSIFNADDIRKIRMELPYGYCVKFPLKGETVSALGKLKVNSQAKRFQRLAEVQAAIERDRLQYLANDAIACCDRSVFEVLEQEDREREEAQKHPSSYSVSVFKELCLKAATDGLPGYRHCDNETHSLERELAIMCLDPEWDFSAGGPWHFPSLIETLREYKADFIKQKTSGVITTTLGKEVCDALDYTFYGRILTLMQGEARTGKSFAARTWCEQHPGLARFVEVPSSNDEAGFFRALARGLGLGNF
jgi:hypothetical protein